MLETGERIGWGLGQSSGGSGVLGGGGGVGEKDEVEREDRSYQMESGY